MNFINKNEKCHKNLNIWCVCVCVCMRVFVSVCVCALVWECVCVWCDWCEGFSKTVLADKNAILFTTALMKPGTTVITAHPVLSGLWVTGVTEEGMVNLAGIFVFSAVLLTLLFSYLEDWFSTRSVVCASDISTNTSLQSGSWDIPSSRKKESIQLPLGLSQLSRYILLLLLSSSPLPTDSFFLPHPWRTYFLYATFWPLIYNRELIIYRSVFLTLVFHFCSFLFFMLSVCEKGVSQMRKCNI